MGGLGVSCFAPLVSCCHGAILGLLRHVSWGRLFSWWYHLQPDDTPRPFPGIFCHMTNPLQPQHIVSHPPKTTLQPQYLVARSVLFVCFRQYIGLFVVSIPRCLLFTRIFPPLFSQAFTYIFSIILDRTIYTCYHSLHKRQPLPLKRILQKGYFYHAKTGHI